MLSKEQCIHPLETDKNSGKKIYEETYKLALDIFNNQNNFKATTPETKKARETIFELHYRWFNKQDICLEEFQNAVVLIISPHIPLNSSRIMRVVFAQLVAEFFEKICFKEGCDTKIIVLSWMVDNTRAKRKNQLGTFLSFCGEKVNINNLPDFKKHKFIRDTVMWRIPGFSEKDLEYLLNKINTNISDKIRRLISELNKESTSIIERSLIEKLDVDLLREQNIKLIKPMVKKITPAIKCLNNKNYSNGINEFTRKFFEYNGFKNILVISSQDIIKSTGPEIEQWFDQVNNIGHVKKKLTHLSDFDEQALNSLNIKPWIRCSNKQCDEHNRIHNNVVFCKDRFEFECKCGTKTTIFISDISKELLKDTDSLIALPILVSYMITAAFNPAVHFGGSQMWRLVEGSNAIASQLELTNFHSKYMCIYLGKLNLNIMVEGFETILTQTSFIRWFDETNEHSNRSGEISMVKTKPIFKVPQESENANQIDNAIFILEKEINIFTKIIGKILDTIGLLNKKKLTANTEETINQINNKIKTNVQVKKDFDRLQSQVRKNLHKFVNLRDNPDQFNGLIPLLLAGVTFSKIKEETKGDTFNDLWEQNQPHFVPLLPILTANEKSIFSCFTCTMETVQFHQLDNNSETYSCNGTCEENK